MATKSELAIAAIQVLRGQGKTPTLENVNELLKKQHGKTVSKQLFYTAKSQAIKMAVGEAFAEKEPPTTAAPPRPTPPAGSVDKVTDALTLIELAKGLIEAAGGDRETVIKLIRTV